MQQAASKRERKEERSSERHETRGKERVKRFTTVQQLHRKNGVTFVTLVLRDQLNKQFFIALRSFYLATVTLGFFVSCEQEERDRMKDNSFDGEANRLAGLVGGCIFLVKEHQ